MALEIFVLSILRNGPVHGYELKRRVQRPSLTQLSNNSLYPMLRRFESEGFVTKSIEAQDGKPARNIYRITAAGRERLRILLTALPPDLADSEEEFLVRLSFFHEIPEANQREIIAAREAALATSRAQVSSLLDEIEPSDSTTWRSRVMNHVLERLDDERTWIATMAEKAAAQ